LDLLGHDGLIGKIIILLPNYRAKIKSVKINSKQLDIEIETEELALKDLLGKVWCEGEEGEETQEDISFDQLQKTISLECTPKDVYVYLLSKSRDEVIDYWQRLSRRFPPKIKIDMTTDEILELIKGWENQQVEFKEEGVEANKLAKELIAFANTNGGIILIGVDDECVIKGITVPKKFEEKIRNIAKNNCNPLIQLETKEYTVDNKKIMAIFVPQGRHRPYQRNDGKFFVRKGSITGPADPTEVRELTKDI
ncbi:MAG: putative DNA binding domain-containing protein, partial [Methanophagales archaeon]|nr:putative DNA binding domain-containing protein [Methanophagales archaeon]